MRNACTLFSAAAAATAACLALAGCTDALVGFQASFSSNTVAVVAKPSAGGQLRFRVPKRIIDLAKRNVYFVPRKALLHLPGYLPMAPDGVDDAGDAYVVSVTLPQDLVKHASRALPNTVRVNGTLYLPSETGIVSFTGTELREPGAAFNVGVTLSAVHAGPMTRVAGGVGGVLRGLYSAR
jgi:hypothetical protein